MPNPIEINGKIILSFLVENEIERVDNKILLEKCGVEKSDFIRGIDYLVTLGAIELLKDDGIKNPQYSIILKSKGEYIYRRDKKILEILRPGQHRDNLDYSKILHNKTLKDDFKTAFPVGSPYGFLENDWAYMNKRKNDKLSLYIVLGLQYKSAYYDTGLIISNIEKYLHNCLNTYNISENKQITLVFNKLTAGLGEHLFNNIAREIISSDIAIFDVSDLTPNVMIEVGVALTWGVKLIPLKNINSPVPPSDISGHTYVEYEESCGKFCEPKLVDRIIEMIDRIIKTK